MTLPRNTSCHLLRLCLAVALIGASLTFGPLLSPASAATKAPKLKKVKMMDRDKDGRADAMKLIYTRKIKHRVDKDGTYPFDVEGYHIKKVGRARVNKLVIVLHEKQDSDWTAAPRVTYTRTKFDPVKGKNGRQAANQIFSKTLSLEKVTGKYLLTLTSTGHGTLRSADGETVCGSRCAIRYEPGATAAFVAIPDAGSIFAGWGEACATTGLVVACAVMMDSTKAASASFIAAEEAQELLLVTTLGNGLVTSDPAGVSCPDVCSDLFDLGSTVTLTAVPAAGETFTGWSGACTGTDPTCVVTLDAAQFVIALFTAEGEIVPLPEPIPLPPLDPSLPPLDPTLPVPLPTDDPTLPVPLPTTDPILDPVLDPVLDPDPILDPVLDPDPILDPVLELLSS